MAQLIGSPNGMPLGILAKGYFVYSYVTGEQMIPKLVLNLHADARRYETRYGDKISIEGADITEAAALREWLENPPEQMGFVEDSPPFWVKGYLSDDFGHCFAVTMPVAHGGGQKKLEVVIMLPTRALGEITPVISELQGRNLETRYLPE